MSATTEPRTRLRRRPRGAGHEGPHGLAPDAPPPPAGTRRLAGEQLAVAGGQLVAGVGNALFALLAARVLAPGAFADLAAFLALYLLIHVPAASLSAGSALTPELAAHARRRTLLAGCAVGAALAAFSVPLGAVLNVSPLLLLAAAAAAPTAGLIALDRGRLYALGRHTRAVGSLLAEPAVRLAIGVALAAVAGPVGGAVAVVAAGWAALAVAHLPAGRAPAAPADGARAGFRPAGVVLAFALLAVVQNQDVLFANALLDGDEAGRFAVLSTLGGIAAFATTTVPLMLLPRAGRSAGGDAARRVALGVAVALGAAAVAAVAVSPSALVTSVFGDAYAAVAPTVVPYVLAMALLGVARVLVADGCARGRTVPAVVLLGAVALLQATLIVVLAHDAAGVARATLVATAALTAGAGALCAPSPSRALARAAALAGRRDVALVGAMTAGGLGLRLLATRGIWLDEATSVQQAQMSIPDLMTSLRTTDVHPPLHYLVLWVTVRTLGTGELAVRLPSLIASTALVPVLFLAGRELWDRRAGLAAAVLVAIAPFPVWYAQEARMYALFMLFAAIGVWMQVRILKRGRAGDWVAFTVTAVALTYTQYFSLLLIAVQQLGFLVALWRPPADGPGRRRLALGWAGSALALVVLILPALSFAHAQFAANEAAGKGFEALPSQTNGSVTDGGTAPGAYQAIANAIWAVLGYHSDATMTALAALWPLGMLLGLALLGRGRSPRTLLVVACTVLPILALFGLGQLKPFVFEVRYFVGAVPLVLLLVARATTNWTVRPTAGLAATGVAAAALGLGLADQQLNDSNPRIYDFRGAVQDIEAHARPGDTIAYAPQYLGTVVGYYDREGLRAVPLDRGLPVPRAGHRVFVLASFLDKAQYRDQAFKAVRELRRDHVVVPRPTRPQIRTWEVR